MVLTGLVRVVDDEGVAGRDGVAEAPPDLVHLRRQWADVQRLRNALRHHAALAVEDGEGEILALLDDGRIAGAQHVERELARDLQRRLVDDFEVDGVQSGFPIRALARDITLARRADVNSWGDAAAAGLLAPLLPCV